MKGRSSDRSVKQWRQQHIKGHCPFWQAISLRQRISGLFVPGCWVGCGCSRRTRTASGFERNRGRTTSSRRSRLICFVGFLWTNSPELFRGQIGRPLADCSGAWLNFVVVFTICLDIYGFCTLCNCVCNFTVWNYTHSPLVLDNSSILVGF